MDSALIVARDPGAASALAPVAQRCASAVIGLANARPVFERAGIPLIGPHSDSDDGVAEHWIRARNPQVLLTGTSRLDLVPLDARWWAAARAAHVPSVALLDHWIGYWERFTLRSRFDVMPDVIAVMDDYARSRLIHHGCDAARIVVTGHPAFDALIHGSALAGREQARSRWGVSNDDCVVLFASEPIAADVGGARGYDEADALATLLHALPHPRLHLVVKPHPRESPSRLAAVLSGSHERARLETELTGLESIAGADVVVGMTSVLLLEAAFAGRPALSIQPGTREPWTDHFQSLVTTVESVTDVRAWLEAQVHQVALEPAERAARIRLAGLDERGTATDAVCQLLHTLSSRARGRIMNSTPAPP